MTHKAKIWAVVPAAGVGKRMQADKPKQYLTLSGKTVIEHTLHRLLDASVFSAVAVAISEQDPYWPELTVSRHPDVISAAGGKERADSVLSALKALTQAHEQDWVMVHDAARPCLTTMDILALLQNLEHDAIGGILAVPSHDTLKSVEAGEITGSVDRNKVWRALTPQMFRFGLLRDALQQAEGNAAVTDEASALELKGLKPKIVEGRVDNIKITRPEDLALAQFYMEQQ